MNGTEKTQCVPAPSNSLQTRVLRSLLSATPGLMRAGGVTDTQLHFSGSSAK